LSGVDERNEQKKKGTTQRAWGRRRAKLFVQRAIRKKELNDQVYFLKGP